MDGADGCGIYYETCKDILCGSELLVWYGGDTYVQSVRAIPAGVLDYTTATHCVNGVDEQPRFDADVAAETNCEFVTDDFVLSTNLLSAITDHISVGDNAITSVRLSVRSPSVRLFSLNL